MWDGYGISVARYKREMKNKCIMTKSDVVDYLRSGRTAVPEGCSPERWKAMVKQTLRELDKC